MNIIQVYAPTNDKKEDEVKKFYITLDEAMKLTKKGEITMVMGDFNSKLGHGAEGEYVEAFGLGNRNSRGDRLVQFCTKKYLFAANTFFKQHNRRLYTWKSSMDCEKRIIRNQTDFILLGLTLRKYVKSVKTYPGADVNSDHNPVVMDFRFRRFIKTKKNETGKKLTSEN